ncbi:MAG: archease [Candidatus Mcinerneyibacterium aminivorans]|uniref:Archease n=1 Tax=Candidatus Mcinerneyibacterium aminivorans TaxID=2703815 RepID=A0A5D0MKB3_9BACT|nr:MAG: archease [Candidatus Mcinerneyibacterium aminivorans]
MFPLKNQKYIIMWWGINMFEEIDHTADLALQVRAKNIEELFTEAARGMFYLMFDEDTKKNKSRELKIQLDSFSLENLLVDFLNELLYISDKDDLALNDLKIKIINNKKKLLKSTINLIKNANKKTAIKAATYHNLKIRQKGNYYQVQITFDI